MFRNGLLASVAALALSGSLWAGELDNERPGAKVPAPATIQGGANLLGTSEMDAESPTQAWFHRGCGYGYRASFYGGGFGGGGFYRASFYGGGCGPYYGGGGFYRASYYGGGFYGGGGGFYRASFYGSGFRGGCW